MPKRPFLLGNWKMNKTVAQARAFAAALAARGLPPGIEVAIAPPATALASLSAEGHEHLFSLCAQDAYFLDEGSYTGALSVPLLQDAGAKALLVGHSERRAHFGEDDALAARKVAAAWRAGLHVVLCVGEEAHEHDVDRGEARVRQQLQAALGAMPMPPMALTVAYEPVWAIGRSSPAEPQAIALAHRLIRAQLQELFGDAAQHVRVVYGGGVQVHDVARLMATFGVDGLLVGKASLSADSFAAIVAAMHAAKASPP